MVSNAKIRVEKEHQAIVAAAKRNYLRSSTKAHVTTVTPAEDFSFLVNGERPPISYLEEELFRELQMCVPEEYSNMREDTKSVGSQVRSI